MTQRRWRYPVALLCLLAVVATPGTEGEAAAQAPPAAAEAGSTDWRQVDAGGNHTCGIRTSGRLYCWGNNAWGQVGRGTDVASYPTLVEVVGGHQDWTAVSVGDYHTCGRRASGRLYCWGDDGFGQLGNGLPEADQNAPVLVAGGVTNWTSVSAGGNATCARRGNGRVYCWGRDSDGELGNGLPYEEQPSPVLVAGGHTDWTAVSVGVYHACGRRASGRLYCWGDDGNGELGNGLPQQGRPIPVLVAGGHTDWTSVSAGNAFTCGRRANGRLLCWGRDEHGTLGNGNPLTDRPTPALVAGGHTDWSSVTAGRFHACGRRSTGRLYCWGVDDDGRLGNGGANTDTPGPSPVGAATHWTQVTTGDYHTCARTTARRLYCWGDDNLGQLGTLGANADENRPAQVHVP